MDEKKGEPTVIEDERMEEILCFVLMEEVMYEEKQKKEVEVRKNVNGKSVMTKKEINIWNNEGRKLWG